MMRTSGAVYEEVKIHGQPGHGLLKQHETGMSVADLAREHGCSTAMIYQWRSKFGSMDASLMKRMKELEAENARLKKMYAEERIKAEIRKEALEGKL